MGEYNQEIFCGDHRTRRVEHMGTGRNWENVAGIIRSIHTKQ